MMESPPQKGYELLCFWPRFRSDFTELHRLDQADELIFHGLRMDQFRDSDMGLSENVGYIPNEIAI